MEYSGKKARHSASARTSPHADDDFDSVKTKLRDLWTQYGASGGSGSNGSNDVGVRGGNSQTAAAAAAPPAPVEEVLLFPTYAYRDEQLKVWRVQVRGWAFCRNPTTRRVRLSAALIRKFIRIPAGGDPDRMLVDRVSYLFAGSPASTDLIKVAMAGISEPAPFELHTTANSRGDVGPASRGRSASDSAHAHTHAPPVSLLDAPIVLTSRFDPAAPSGAARNTTNNSSSTSTSNNNSSSSHNGNSENLMNSNSGSSNSGNHRLSARAQQIRDAQYTGVAPTIIQKALQIDAFSWQNLVLDEGSFKGEVLLGYNELEWLTQSYPQDNDPDQKSGESRRVIELRGKLYGWPDHRVITGLAHLVEPRGVSVVSDIDDTIKASNITAEKRIVLETAFARPLLAVPGMAALYRHWYQQGAEFHYVSNSPWQLYPTLDGFFHRHKFPPGSAHLRSFDPNDLLSIKNYTGTPQLKRDTIGLLFRTFPERKFVLVGDCGEHDLETYAELAREFPGRVLRIYIRDLFAPMSVASVTTDVDAAGNKSVNSGVIPLGVVQPLDKDSPLLQNNTGSDASRSSGSGSNRPSVVEADLIGLHDETADAQSPLNGKTAASSPTPPPPVPPKPAHLRTKGSAPIMRPSASNPPPKPARTFNNASAPASRQNNQQLDPPMLPPRKPLQQQPQQQPMLDDATAAERIEAKINELREQAQEWMAFYAQQFYVAPTRSFICYARTFMPTVKQNMHIIDYEAIPDAVHHHAAMVAAASAAASADPSASNNANVSMPGQMPPSFSSSSVPPPIGGTASAAGNGQATSFSGSNNSRQGTMQSALSFSALDIPEPPPSEAQLARNSRRLLLWKRYLRATQGLPPDMCRLFVDAGDIMQDVELFDTLFPRHSYPQI
ncbi:hypothetical protein IWW48_004367 [Coemansia sp. RSA 1200]|nr:hypothetical protein IWW48_004367 [Coemansia sp. RSA 1200]